MSLKHISTRGTQQSGEAPDHGPDEVADEAAPTRRRKKVPPRSGPASSEPQVQTHTHTHLFKSFDLMQPAHILYAVVLPASEY